jgi:hypothetical protein
VDILPFVSPAASVIPSSIKLKQFRGESVVKIFNTFFSCMSYSLSKGMYKLQNVEIAVFRCERARGREGERARGREGERARGREGERARGREGERARGREGERARESEKGRAIWHIITFGVVRIP